MKEIFTDQGIKVETKYYPFKRALLNVEKGNADISGGTEKDSPNYIHSRYPAWVVRSTAMFDKKYLPDWKGLETIREHIDKTVSPPVTGEEYGIPLHEVRTRYAAIRMVVRDKMRYYIDDYTILKDLFHKNGGLAFEEGKETSDLANVDWSRFTIQELPKREWRMVFPNTERGRMVREIFDAGFKRLYESGKLRELYAKWDLQDVMVQEIHPETNSTRQNPKK
nr:hypothetical protein [Maridesulfovibrio salexigens]